MRLNQAIERHFAPDSRPTGVDVGALIVNFLLLLLFAAPGLALGKTAFSAR